MDTLLTDEQTAFLLEHRELIDAVLKIADSDAFKTLFGTMTPGEALDRYEAALNDADETSDPTLRERYRRLKASLATNDHTEMIQQLRESADFWDKELSE